MRLHSLLLYLYPASFRGEYAKELSQMFQRRREQAATPWAVLFLWLGEIVDVLRNALFAHWDILRQDLKYSARNLSRARGFTLAAILVTGLGIGANTAAFSVVDRVLLRPLPFPDSERLVQLWQHSDAYSRVELSPPNFYDWRRLSTSFDAMGAYTQIAVNMVGDGQPQRIEGVEATPDFFQVLNIRPALGRLLNEDDAREGAPATVVLSHKLWQNAFGGRPEILGSTIRLDGEVCTVVGIMARNFVFPNPETQFWKPMSLGDPPKDTRDNLYLRAIGRLKPGVAIGKARSEMNVIAAQLAREYPKENANVGAAVDPLSDQASNESRLLLWGVFGASLCVLLIACSNLASLLLARTIGRRRELSVRTAIGAGRERLVRQFATESLILAGAGGLVGVFVAMAATPLISAMVPSHLPVTDITILDPRVLGFALLVTLGTAVVFGILPALRISTGISSDALREGSRSAAGGRKEGLRAALVVAEISITVALLVSSGLLIRALWRVQSLDPGFHGDSAIGVQTPLPLPRYGIAATRNDFYRSVLSNVRRLPGVSAAAYISSLPMEQGGGIWPLSIPGINAANPNGGGANVAAMRIVTDEYFSAMGIPLKNGRDFNDADSLDSPYVAVISESFAHKYWPNQNPIGRVFHFAMTDFKFGQTDRTVVGVAGDVRFRGLEQPSEPQVYLFYRQYPDNTSSFYTPKELVVRSARTTSTLVPSIRGIIHSADPELPISAVRTLRQVIEQQTAPRSTQIQLVGTFAALSLILAALGIHGLLSFAVGQRSAEFGVRIALGAQRADIVSIVLREGLMLAVIGGFFGAALSYYAAQAMQALLAGVGPFDPWTILLSAAVALTMTLSGSLVPAVRAMRTDPSTIIRGE